MTKTREQIAELLDQEYVPEQRVDELSLHPRNPRRGDVDRIAESIRTNGFYGTVMVQRSTGYVLYGNHRLEAARRVGLTTVPALWVDVDDAAALRILVTDNATSDHATYDDTDLSAVLAELAKTDTGLTGSGWNQAEYDELLARLSGDDPMPPSDASLLELSAVVPGDPRHKVFRGDVWRLGPVVHDLGDEPGWTAGPHHLCVVPVASGWPTFTPLLDEGVLLLPYTGPYIAVTKPALRSRCLFVQPSGYVAGHMLDKWEDLFGSDSLEQIEGKS